MGGLALDSNVVSALLDATDAHHDAARAALESVELASLAVSVIVYAEVLAGAMKRGPDAVVGTEEFFASLPRQPVPVSREIARSAALLRIEHRGVKLPDALILATAEALESDEILTADARWGQVSSRVRVIGRG